jgi:glycosyltransferase involved in cell wall biosynthesis
MIPITLSVVIPAYNEAAFIGTLLDRIQAVDLAAIGVAPELIVVDDGSADDTAEIAGRHGGVRVIRQRPNAGKGAAVRAGIAAATGTHVLIQDADLEYDPQDYIPMLEPLMADRADVVYGSRFKGSIEGMRFLNRIGNLTMTGAARVLYGVNVSDLMTCYKMYRSSLVKGLRIEANGFDFEAEFTARLAQRGARFTEVPVSFSGRTFEEGKKIRAFDAVRVMRELIRCKIQSEAHG